MMAYVKEKFDFLAAFCIVAFFYLLLGVIATQYMHKKIKKYNARMLSHKNDNFLLVLLLLFIVVMSGLTYWQMPKGPNGPPQPLRGDHELTDVMELYSMKIDR